MTVVNAESGTRVDEIASGIFRICTRVPPGALPDGFTFSQFLIIDDQPLLFHTGLRGMFPHLRGAIQHLMPVEELRYVCFSHVEADECGALNELLAMAPSAEPLCGQVAAMTSINDLADRPPRELADGEVLSLGEHEVVWLDTPHLPHAWECGLLFEQRTGTLFCSDLFSQGGADPMPLTEGDILKPSEGMRGQMDYYAHPPNERAMLERLAGLEPKVLACMHGSSWRGDGARLLRALADRLEAVTPPGTDEVK